MLDLFSDRARRTIVLAQEQVYELRHDAIGPSHFLLAVLQDGDRAATWALRAHGITYESLQPVVNRLDANGIRDWSSVPLFTPDAKRVLSEALEEARLAGSPLVDAAHLVLAILRDTKSTAAAALDELEADKPVLRNEILALLANAWSYDRWLPPASTSDPDD